jgi:hypothetical protein
LLRAPRAKLTGESIPNRILELDSPDAGLAGGTIHRMHVLLYDVDEAEPASVRLIERMLAKFTLHLKPWLLVEVMDSLASRASYVCNWYSLDARF